MNSNKVTLGALAAIAAALSLAVVPALTNQAFAAVSGTTDVSCTNNGGQTPPGQQASCQNEEGLTQNTCAATTGNGKCPPGQNK